MSHLTMPGGYRAQGHEGQPSNQKAGKTTLQAHGDAKKSERQGILDFFNCQVANLNPDLLIDVCDYWLSQIQFKVPSSQPDQLKT